MWIASKQNYSKKICKSKTKFQEDYNSMAKLDKTQAILKKLFVSGVAPGYDFTIIIFYPPARYIFLYIVVLFIYLFFLNVLL